MRRAFLLGLTLMLSLLGPAVVGASAANTASHVAVRALDIRHVAVLGSFAETERVALTRYDLDANPNGLHSGSSAPSLFSMAKAGDVHTDYDRPVHDAGIGRTTQVRAGRGLTGLPVPSHGGVAAKSVDDLAETAARVCSFSGATLVLMAEGTKKPIDQIEVGDEVLATDPETGEQASRRVEHVFVHDDALTDLALSDGTVLTTTEDHPYWSVDDQHFERADELSQGERVLGADGRTIEVSGLRLATTRDGRAYNLAVDGIHTYHVGDDEILVHNSCFSSLDALNNPKSLEGLTPSQIDDLARNAGFEVRAGSASAKNPATRYYLPGTNGSQGFRVLPQGVPGQPGVKSGAYLKYFGGPLHGTRVPLGKP